jgi:hypothetical protein
MSSDLPPKPQAGGSGTYIRAAVVMLLLASALVFWKITRSSGPEPTTNSGDVLAEPPKVEVTPPPPPPPEPEPSASASASAAPAAKAARSGGGCSATCNGEVGNQLKVYVAGRAAQGRKCYERALLQNAALKGHMKVQLRVGAQGQLCSSSIVGDELNDPGLSMCIQQLFRNSVFPAPQAGCVDVAVPLSFVPQR